MVPIVEPEVLMEGDHDIDKCFKVTTDVLNECFNELAIQKVSLKGIVLKPNMVVPGFKCSKKATSEEIAKKPLDCLKKNDPNEVPGIAFLSGGQNSDIATEHLNKMNQSNTDLPWNLTFSYGRALQQDALNIWQGKNRSEAQSAFLNRAKNNSLATIGEY